MDEHGKKLDILFVDVINADQQTGIKTISETEITLWADAKNKDLIKKNARSFQRIQ